jgi:hypothetical protein
MEHSMLKEPGPARYSRRQTHCTFTRQFNVELISEIAPGENLSDA